MFLKRDFDEYLLIVTGSALMGIPISFFNQI